MLCLSSMLRVLMGRDCVTLLGLEMYVYIHVCNMELILSLTRKNRQQNRLASSSESQPDGGWLKVMSSSELPCFRPP